MTAKDIVLHLLALPSSAAAAAWARCSSLRRRRSRRLTTDERATLTNMTAELGGLTGIVAPDDETVRFLRERRGLEFAIEPWMHSDPGAHYAETIHVDCNSLPPRRVARATPATASRSTQLGRAVKDRHRVRRIVHRRQARGLRPLP